MATSLLLFSLIASSLVDVSDGCSLTSDCESAGELCCNNDCFYGSSCVGQSQQSCTSNTECDSGESCCYYQCKYGSDCIGYSCSIDSDCGNPYRVSCCFGTCQNIDDSCYDSDDSTAVIVGSMFGAVLVMFLIAMCIFAYRRRRRAHRGRVIVGGRVTGTTTTTTRNATQTNPLYRDRLHSHTNKAIHTTPHRSMNSSRRAYPHHTALPEERHHLPHILEHHREDQGEYILLHPLMVLCHLTECLKASWLQ
ncbi:hypothetical protein OS493_035390 [Desmophyllum pertusum]|uniref:Uncharacterized protein n=1 Tax=Desmophyllum pertusum TaxID=174260 RepID=A0A9W9ZW51_9CNID|nr:hypothetical protein OS493_035390 [Desmophyllum pertusum]